jgi:hypothetical protein
VASRQAQRRSGHVIEEEEEWEARSGGGGAEKKTMVSGGGGRGCAIQRCSGNGQADDAVEGRGDGEDPMLVEAVREAAVWTRRWWRRWRRWQHGLGGSLSASSPNPLVWV